MMGKLVRTAVVLVSVYLSTLFLFHVMCVIGERNERHDKGIIDYRLPLVRLDSKKSEFRDSCLPVVAFG